MVSHQVFLASTLQWCKPKLLENTVTNTTIATIRKVDCVDITQMSHDQIFDMCGVPTRQEAGEIVFQQIRSLMEDGHSQVLTREHAQQIAAYALKLLS